MDGVKMDTVDTVIYSNVMDVGEKIKEAPHHVERRCTKRSKEMPLMRRLLHGMKQALKNAIQS